jgi:hypothetical protein
MGHVFMASMMASCNLDPKALLGLWRHLACNNICANLQISRAKNKKLKSLVLVKFGDIMIEITGADGWSMER